jgi:hypothetical protein
MAGGMHLIARLRTLPSPVTWPGGLGVVLPGYAQQSTSRCWTKHRGVKISPAVTSPNERVRPSRRMAIGSMAYPAGGRGWLSRLRPAYR